MQLAQIEVENLSAALAKNKTLKILKMNSTFPEKAHVQRYQTMGDALGGCSLEEFSFKVFFVCRLQLPDFSQLPHSITGWAINELQHFAVAHLQTIEASKN